MSTQPSASSKRPPSATSRRASRSPTAITKGLLLRAFDAGDFSSFFRHWPAIIAENRDIAVRHLDFYIRVYFATQRFRESTSKIKHEQFNRPMENFKSFLESAAGVELGKCADLTPYFGLPYVKNLEKHPLFRDLKDQKWVTLIRLRLVDFIDTKLCGAGALPNSIDAGKSGEESMEALKDRLAQSERKHQYYKNKCLQFQANYHRLILVASELVDALEQTIQGSLISPEHMQDLRARMFDTRTNGGISSVRTLSTEDEDKADELVIGKEAPDDPEPSNMTLPPGNQSFFTNESCESIPTSLGIIDWQKIRHKLADSISDKGVALLLQALRLCLTKSERFESRLKLLSSMVEEDVLSVKQPEGDSTVERLIHSGDLAVQEAICRLINTFTCFKLGRSYLLISGQFLPMLVGVIRNNQLCQTALCHSLVTFQKCSIRRRVQLQLIRLGFLNWLIEYLHSFNTTLSSYALEYGVALLMNLSLTTAGKKAAAEDPELILSLLCNLMEHEDAYVISPYVNGTLFSVLSLANVRFKAKKMGLHSVLDKAVQRPKTASDIRQIPFIVKQLNGELADIQQPPSDDECPSSIDDKSGNGNESEDENIFGSLASESQVPDLLEPELDDGDTLAPDTTYPLAGFELLKTNYCKVVSESIAQNVVRGEGDNCIVTLSAEALAPSEDAVKPKGSFSRPRQRPVQSSGRRSPARMTTSAAQRGRGKAGLNGTAQREALGLVEGAPSKNGGAHKSATVSSTTYLVRSADSQGHRRKRTSSRDSITSLPSMESRNSLTRSIDFVSRSCRIEPTTDLVGRRKLEKGDSRAASARYHDEN